MANLNFTNSVDFSSHLTLTPEFNFFLSLARGCQRWGRRGSATSAAFRTPHQRSNARHARCGEEGQRRGTPSWAWKRKKREEEEEEGGEGGEERVMAAGGRRRWDSVERKEEKEEGQE